MSDNEDDLYADLYGGAEQTAAPEESAAPASTGAADSSKPAEDVGGGSSASARPAAPAQDDHGPAAGRDPRHGGSASPAPASAPSRPSEKPLPPPGTRADVPPAARLDDGKMFIGGLNWDTTDDGLSDYFSQFGRVLSCTVMRDPSSGRSRGFAFLTFEDPASVNDVMIREHFLDGKAIDPKRAIPRNEERSTDKLFVRNIPPGVTQPMLQDYFGKFGMLTDCTLMMDRDTRQHRGFGFVTFKDEVTVDRVVNNQPYTIFGQQIEVKRSAPRRGEEGGGFRGGRGRGGGGGYSAFNHSNSGGGGGGYGNSAGGGMMGGAGANPMMGGMGMGMNPMGMMGGFDPSAMAEYFKNMGWGQWNPAMMMNPMMNPMMGGAGAGAGAGASGGMMMPGMPAASSPVPGSSGGHGGGGGGGGRAGEAKSLSPPPNAPTGPKGGSSSGPVRNNPGGRGYHPYSR